MHKFRSVLVDVDATAAAHPAFERACDLAATCGATVTLVDVLPDLPRGARQVMPANVEQDLVERRRVALAAHASRRPEVHVDTAVLRGRPAVAIVQEVLRKSHDLVVRAHARDLKPGRLLGAVDMQLLRKCPCPVWLVGPETSADAPRILATVDVESEEPAVAELNRTIVDLALTVAELQGAGLTVLHVWSLYGEELLKSWMGPQELHDALDAKRTAASTALDALTKQFGTRAAAVRRECLKGEPHEVIPNFVAAHDVSLVVMGTVARTGIAGFVMGNTAETVLRQMRGSVLAVKPPGFVTPITLEDARG